MLNIYHIICEAVVYTNAQTGNTFKKKLSGVQFEFISYAY